MCICDTTEVQTGDITSVGLYLNVLRKNENINHFSQIQTSAPRGKTEPCNLKNSANMIKKVRFT